MDIPVISTNLATTHKLAAQRSRSAAGGRTTTHLRLADGVGATPFPTRLLQPLVRLGLQLPLLGNPCGTYAEGSYL
jgi:hypothetical protein